MPPHSERVYPRKHKYMCPSRRLGGRGNCTPQIGLILNNVINSCYFVQAMSSERFASYWLYIFDLHNLYLTGDLCHTANPTSKYRMENIVMEMMSDMKM